MCVEMNVQLTLYETIECVCWKLNKLHGSLAWQASGSATVA